MATNTKTADVIFAKDIAQFFGLESQKAGISSLNLNKYVNFPEVMTLMKVKSLTAKGFSFETKDEALSKWFDKFQEDNDLLEIIEKILYDSFKFGVALVGFNRLSDGSGFKMFVCDSAFRPQYKIHDQEIISVSFLSRRLRSSFDASFYIKESWNFEEVKRMYMYDTQRIQVGDITTHIPEKYILPLEEANPYKAEQFIPFQDFPNYSFSPYPDWYHCVGLIEQFNFAQDNYTHEIKSNQSYMNLSTDITTSKEFNAKIQRGEKPHFLIATTGENDLNVFPQSLSHSEHSLGTQKMIANIFSFSQLSFASDLTGGGQTTAREIAQNNSGFVDSCNKSRITWERNAKKLLRKLFIASGFAPDVKFSIKLNENTVLSREQQRADVLERYQNGFLDRAGAIEELNGVSREEAEELAVKYEAEEDKKIQKEMDNQLKLADKYNADSSSAPKSSDANN